MTWWSWLWAPLALLFLLDANKLRARAAALAVLPPSDEPVDPAHAFLVAPGVALDEPTKRAASAHAKKHGISVLDLVPRGLPALRLWGLLQFVDPDAYRRDRLGRGVSFGHAALVDRDVLERARAADAVADDVALVRLVGELKRYACTATDLAVAPGLHAAPTDRRHRFLILRELLGDGVSFVLAGTPILLAIVVAGAIVAGIPGLVALGAFHVQPLFAFVGGPLEPRGVVVGSLLRTLLEALGWVNLLIEKAPERDPDAVRARRAEYDELVREGLDPFFEPRRTTCPVCDAAELEPYVRATDMLQHKPGRFTLERCTGCGHVFQNPRLSLRGLDFYYKDFYDGLGAENLDRIFGVAGPQYAARARMVKDLGEPKKWLDVGGGHGHFCCAARELLPDTRFDALDLSESIDDGVRRGWVDHGYRGLFPEVAPRIAAEYDVVSMSHYLEHTREPREEIRAAATALADGGLLLVEVPDPECPMGRLLGRLWLPWFQPQHQHLLSVANLERLMREEGLAPLSWHRGEAHQRVDFLAAVILFVNWIAPEADVPWQPVRGKGAQLFRTTMYALAIPALLAGKLLDGLVGPIVERTRGSNTYRVLARKERAGRP